MTDDNAPPGGSDADDDQFAVRLKVSRVQADEILRRGSFDFGDRPHISPNPDGTGSLDLFLDRRQIESLRAEGFEVEVGLNQSARGRERLTEVGQGDRFEGGKIPPRGLGRKIGGRVGSGDVGPDDGPEGAS
jgi:hypothetical protein